MKKNNIVLALAAAMLLASCGNTGGNSSEGSSGHAYDGSTDSSSQTTSGEATSGEATSGEATSSEEEEGWTAEEKELMMEHLHGFVLPYVDLEGAELSYDEEYDSIAILGGDSTAKFLKNYAANFSADEGWIGGASTETSIAGSLYSFEKAFETEEGQRYVYVSFGGYDKENEDYSPVGTFMLMAGDPYYYEFPAAEMNSLARNYSETAFVPDYAHASHYEIDVDYNAVLCYEPEENCLEAYGAHLQDANFKEAVATEGGYLAEGYDGSWQIFFAYSEDYDALMIQVLPGTIFPHDQIAYFYEDYGFQIDGNMIVTYQAENAMFQFAESDYNEMMVEFGLTEGVCGILKVINTTQEEYNAYIDAILDFGWLQNGQPDSYGLQTYTYVDERLGTFSMKAAFSSSYAQAQIVYYAYPTPLPVADWPAEAIAALFPAGVTEVLPAFQGDMATGYDAGTDASGSRVVVYVEGDDAEAAAMASYFATLEAANYVLVVEDPTSGNRLYKSPNGEIVVIVGTYEEGSITISLYANYPAGVNPELAAILAGYVTESDLPPVYDGDYLFTFVEDYTYYYGCATVNYVFAPGADVEAAVAAYGAQLEAAGFTYDGGYYYDAAQTMALDLYIDNSGNMVLDIYPLAVD